LEIVVPGGEIVLQLGYLRAVNAVDRCIYTMKR